MKQLALIILILLTLASCKKESLPQGRFTATTEGCAIKTALNSDGHSLVWQDGDQIKVASSDGQSYLYDLTDNQGSRAGFEYLGVGADPLLTPPYKAGYPPAIWDETCTTVTLPQIQHYKPGSLDQFPMYATSNTDALPFKNLCGVVKLLVNPANAIIYRIDIQANQNISGQFSVAMNNNVPQLTSTTQGSNTVTLLFDTPQTLSASTPIYIYLPAGEYSSFNITLTASNFLCATKRANQAISIQRNGITTINLSSSTLNFSPNAPEGAIPGYFTIDADHHQIYFSKGNLQYIGSAATPYWRFADNQYDYLGTTTGQNSADPNVDRDLFGWGCTGQTTGATAYQPWATSTTDAHYYIGGNYQNDLSGNSDWGYNPISNGGTSHWRTLTSAQWDYLLNQRAASTINNVANARYCRASINGIQGYIIFPDILEWPSSIITQPININNNHHTVPANSYTADQWNTLQQKGCVFLPITGYRTATGIADDSAMYWSSTHFDQNRAYAALISTTSDLGAQYNTHRYTGCPVRLVADLE